MSIFQESWWLEAANPGQWHEVSYIRDGKVVGRWPFSEYQVLGCRVGGMAPLTSTLGPWVAPLSGNIVTRRKQEIEIISHLAKKMPHFAFFRQILPPSQENLLPFQLCGFRLDLEQTFQLNTGESLNKIWDNFQDKLRNQIRMSHKKENVCDDVSIHEFLHIHDYYVSSRNLKDTLDRQAFHRIYNACRLKGSGRIIGLRNAQGDATAALFVVNSDTTMHHLLQTRHPALSTGGSIEALTWHAIQSAHARDLTYDLDGIPNAGAADRLLRYGGRQRNRFIVTYGAPAIMAARSAYKSLGYSFGMTKRFL